MDKQTKWFVDLLKQLQEEGFYGKLVLEMTKGNIVLVRREFTVKPPPKEE